MGKKNSSSRAAPNVSSATSLSAAASTQKSNSSAIIRSAFSPSRFQLSLFASVIQALDSQQLRIHDTTTGRLRCEHTASGAEITALDWGYYGVTNRLPDEQPSKKKRRKLEDANGDSQGLGDVVVGFGTNKSQIHLFSPSEAKILATLSDGHTNGIQDFKFSEFGLDSKAWSLGGDGKLVQWNIRERTIARSISSPTSPATTILPLRTSLLVASDTTHLIDPEDSGKSSKLHGASSATQFLAIDCEPEPNAHPKSYLAAFQHDRYINVYDISSVSINGSLVAEADVTFTATDDGEETKSILGAITTNGDVELFEEPFGFEVHGSMKTSDLKSKRKQMVKRPTATIWITRPGSDDVVPAAGISFQENDLVIAYAEGSTYLSFERIPWKDDSHVGLIIRGDQIIEKTKTVLGADGTAMNGVKDMGRLHVDESRTVVSQGGNLDPNAMQIDEADIIDISSGEDEESDEDEVEDEDDAQQSTKPLANGVQPDTEMAEAESLGSDTNDEADGEEQEDEVEGGPSFGDQLRANAPATIDVEASFSGSKDKQVQQYGKGTVKLPSGLSLATVLSQSLRSNDVNMLESCLHEQDTNIVRATIERLDSSLASRLLQKLAERLHSRPGRSGTLMVWVQWTLIAHGGYIGSQPKVIEQLSSLYRVVKERANALEPLLSLKGKLDMLEAQMNLRKSQQSRLGITGTGNAEDEDAVVYVEGQEESSSEDDASDDEKAAIDEEAFSEEEDIEGGASRHDVGAESEDDSADDLIDDEASETDAEESEGEDLEDEVDHDDVDSLGEESDEEEPAVKSKSKSKLTNGIASKGE